MKQKDPPIQRIKEDTHRVYAQRMESVHKEIGEVNRAEVIDLHAEDKGEEAYSPPVDTEHDDNIYGEFLYETPFTDHDYNDKKMVCLHSDDDHWSGVDT